MWCSVLDFKPGQNCGVLLFLLIILYSAVFNISDVQNI